MDLRKALNAVSDVVNNRPVPLREFDQIYMKSADMLLQAEHVGRTLNDLKVVFVGDGDAIGLSLIHLHQLGILESAPATVHILDFDERVVLSVQRFAKQWQISERITAELYNVADPLPEQHWHAFDAFYTNPPFGASNSGKSIEAFWRRGAEAIGDRGVAYVVLADDIRFEWTQAVLYATEAVAINDKFVISEVVPRFHQYHLDDAPDLTSCSLIAKRVAFEPGKYRSVPLSSDELKDFYGEEAPLTVRYVRDLTGGGRFPSSDYKLEPMPGV